MGTEIIKRLPLYGAGEIKTPAIKQWKQCSLATGAASVF